MPLREGVDVADCGAGEVVDADADEFASGIGDLVVVVADEGQRRAPRVEPAEVGDEGVRQFEAEGAVEVPGGEGGAVA